MAESPIPQTVIMMAGVKFPSCRTVVVWMAFLALCVVWCTRVELNTAIVAMSDFHPNTTQHKSINWNNTFDWNIEKQGVILSSYFYGFILTQYVGGIIADKIGGKLPILMSVGVSSVISLIIPLSVNHGGFTAIVILKVVDGLMQGVTYPAFTSLMSKWAPVNERSKMVSIAWAGSQVGVVITAPIAGELIAYTGWDAVFYLFGCLGLLWCVMWIFFVYESPEKHPRIEQIEKDYILSTTKTKSKIKTPYRKIFTSAPAYAVAVSQFTNNWAIYTMSSEIPSYFSYCLRFNIKENGSLNAIPYLLRFIMMVGSGYIADYLMVKNCLSVTVVRKIFIVTGFLIPAIFLVAVGFCGTDKLSAVILLVLAVGFSGVPVSTFAVNILDIAPNFAGTIMGLSNTFGNIPGLATHSLTAAFIQSDKHDPNNWSHVFFLTAGLYVAGLTFYCVFGSGELQSWAVERQDEAVEEKKTSL